MRLPREPLLAPVLALASGIACTRLLSFEAATLAIALAVLAAIALLAKWRAPKALGPAILACCLVFGAWWAVRHHEPAPPELDSENGETLLVSGCVIQPPELSEARQRMVVELEPGARLRFSLLAKPGEKLPSIEYGQLIEAEAKVRKPRNFRNPGSFDFVHHLARQQIYWTASTRGVAKFRILPGTCGNPWQRGLYRLRAAALERIERLYTKDAYTAAMLQGLLIGEDAKIRKTWVEDFRRTGTYHALVISGLHITVVAGALLTLMRLCGLPLVYVLALAGTAAWLYAGVAAWQPPAVRAAAGFTLFLIARLFFRRGRLLNLLAFTALLFLLIDPFALFEPSFQLSFLSVAAIGALAVPIGDWTFRPCQKALAGVDNPMRDLQHEPRAAQFRVELRLLAETLSLYTRLPLRFCVALMRTAWAGFFLLCELTVVTVAVQIALAIPLIALFHRLSITGVLGNLIVAPALTLAVPLGLLAVVTQWGPLALLPQWLVHLARIISAHLAYWEGNWRLADPPVLFSFALIGALLLLMLALRIGLRRLLWVGVATTLGAFTALIIPHPAPPHDGELELNTIDVGQGDSLFLRLPDGRTMLVDGGGIPTFDPRTPPQIDIGEDVVSPYLWNRGYRRINIVALSHLHDDHAAGLPAILENFQPEELWVGPIPPCDAWTQLQAKAKEIGTRIRTLHQGERVRFGQAEVSVISPAPDYRPKAKPGNNDSLVLELKMGRHHFLLSGDMEAPGEQSLLAAERVPDIDVLKVAHHGSRSSTQAEFLDAARPRFAIISVGAGNFYGHPHPTVLERLQQMGTRIYRTDVDGLITVRSDGRRLRIATFSDGELRQDVFTREP